MDSVLANKPLVSIGLPVLNEENYLRQTVKALLAQDYHNFELIISDNASTDRTAEICREFYERDSRVKYHRHETNVGGVKNFNGVFERASGKYFMWAGGHDLWGSTFVSRAVSVLESDPGVVLVFARAMLIDTHGNHHGIMADDLDTRKLSPLRRYLKLIWNLQSCNTIHGLMRANVLRQSVLLSYAWGSDIILLADLSLRGEFAQIPEVLFYRREVRPEENEDPEAWKKRALATTEGPHQSNRREMSLEELFREMRNEELRLIYASQLGPRDKLRALAGTINCARRRYGVRLPLDPLLRGIAALRSPRMFIKKVRLRLN
ncbi:MAG TPA: glycosyltransferase family 2 protein [Pyrinomonadaceae bacterium]|nr:glycosyltransferase family 2 protein [Pyrinomonadaceae bacterium]